MVSRNHMFIAFAVVIFIAVLITLVATNTFGWGAAVAGFGGPVAAGLYKIFISPLNWALSGGWPTLAAFILFGFVALPIGVAALSHHYHIPEKFQNTVAPNPSNAYTSTVKREPEEPERAPTTAPAAS